MLTVHQFVMVISAIRAFQSGISGIKWLANPFFLSLSIMNLIVELLAQVFMAYKFPLLFVSLVIIGNPLFQREARRLLTKLVKI